jgi:hypothetical protein
MQLVILLPFSTGHVSLRMPILNKKSQQKRNSTGIYYRKVVSLSRKTMQFPMKIETVYLFGSYAKGTPR